MEKKRNKKTTQECLQRYRLLLPVSVSNWLVLYFDAECDQLLCLDSHEGSPSETLCFHSLDLDGAK